MNDGDQDDVTGSRNETKIRGKVKQNNARKERNWKTDFKQMPSFSKVNETLLKLPLEIGSLKRGGFQDTEMCWRCVFNTKSKLLIY